ncbi:MAG TPA: hypothetical protein VHQ90_19180 [Thermoanaerobaculia bacterium]|nr:hypothetical protein [Thermoanaerobaculia bacterium]
MPIDEQYPWDVPVPIRTGDFCSVFPKHKHCNIVTAAERIGPFGVQRQPLPAEQLLFADQQMTPFSYVSRRLGSGRSGVYRGLYLKGIGRTPLAANWNDNDVTHNTGHMTASSAIREYVISVYTRAAGGESSIVPCQGVLLRPLSPELDRLRALLSEAFPEEALPAADGAIQAITVKPGAFARISNFAWLLHHLTPRCIPDGSTSLSCFAKLLAVALSEPYGESASDPREISPQTLVVQLAKAVDRACRHFALWLKLGIWWGSFGNNFTVDGRFLDLETPSVAGGPFLGRLSSEGVLAGPIRRSSVVGTEIFFYLTQMQLFCRLIVQTLSCLPPWFHPIEREFARALAEQIELRLLGDVSILSCRERAVEFALGLHQGAAPGLSLAASARLREILAYEHDRITGRNVHSEPRRAWEETILLGIPPIISDAGAKLRFHALRLAGNEAIVPALEAQERARGLHALIAELDATTDVDELLFKLADVERRVHALVVRTGDSPAMKPAIEEVGTDRAAPVPFPRCSDTTGARPIPSWCRDEGGSSDEPGSESYS